MPNPLIFPVNIALAAFVSWEKVLMLLVVDDHGDIRNALVHLLASAGYEVAGVGSGEEALAFLASHDVSLVVLDYNMPGMNGLTVFLEMKKDERLRNIRVVMFSADAGKTRERALGFGVDAYVVKGSLDWVKLESEIVRLVGPGKGAKKMPRYPKSRTKDAG